MLLTVLLIIIGIPILILPLITKIRENKKLTKSGKLYLVCIFLLALLQILNMIENSKNEILFKKDKIDLKNKVDSLNIRALSLSDSLNNFKNILLSIDSQFYNASKKIFDLKQINDSLNFQLFESDRPIIHFVSAEINKSKKDNNKHEILFNFVNDGNRAVTNVYGKIYSLNDNKIFYHGTLPISQSDIFPNKNGFTISRIMKINPDSTSLEKPIYYYFKLTYSDLILKSSFPYEIVVKIDPFTKGNYKKKLSLCRNWEVNKIKMRIKKLDIIR